MSRRTLLVILVLLSTRGHAWAQQAVWDPAEIAESAEKSAQAAVALSMLVDSVSHLNGLALAIRGGVPAAASGGGSGGAASLGIGPGPGTPPPTGSVDATLATVASRAAASRSLQRQVATDGLALSLAQSGYAGMAAGLSSQLIAQGLGAGDLRDDVAANSAAVVAALRDVVRLKAMIAALLQMRAAGHLNAAATPSSPSTGSAPSSTTPSGGGTS